MKRFVSVSAVILFTLTLSAAEPRVKVVSRSGTSVTLDEQIPERLSCDPREKVCHDPACPDVKPGFYVLSPAAADLQRYARHESCRRRDSSPRYARTTYPLPPNDPSTVKVLFIGNSHTYFNEMPTLFSEIANATEKRTVYVKQSTVSGATLADQWFRGEPLKMLAMDRWDFVVLQERGGIAAMDPATEFDRYAKVWIDEIRKGGAETLLFESWSRAGDPDSARRLQQFWMVAAKQLGVRLLPVGAGFIELTRIRPDINLRADDSHPSFPASYMIACMVYASIFEKSPEGLPYALNRKFETPEFYRRSLEADRLDESSARAIQQVAWRQVRKWPKSSTSVRAKRATPKS